jgi:4'-phosphopantetheinyl transferase
MTLSMDIAHAGFRTDSALTLGAGDRKEAYIKATGEALSLPLYQFDVSLVPRDQRAQLATRPDHAELKRWSLRDAQVNPGYAAALWVSGLGWNLIDWSGED